jgi:hypothetical protein
MFKKAVYEEIKVRVISNNWPEFANASVGQFSNINFTQNNVQPIFTPDLLCKKADGYLEQTSFNKFKEAIHHSPTPDEIYAFISLGNVESGQTKGFTIKTKDDGSVE